MNGFSGKWRADGNLAAPVQMSTFGKKSGNSYAAFLYATSTYIVAPKMLICLWSNEHLRAKWASSGKTRALLPCQGI
jgi:hypothetical protein